jgi:hypothetical protein
MNFFYGEILAFCKKHFKKEYSLVFWETICQKDQCFILKITIESHHNCLKHERHAEDFFHFHNLNIGKFG